MTEHLRDVLKAIAEDPEVLELIAEDPDGFAARFGLDDDQLRRLRGTTILVRRDRNPLLELGDPTTLPPVTIIGHPQITFTTEPITITITAADAPTGPQTLYELSHEQLVQLAQRVLTDDGFAQRVRTFLKL
jgi:hypothetical protein